MESETITRYLGELRQMMLTGIFDLGEFDRITNYIIKHSAVHSGDADFRQLKAASDEVAQRFGRKDVDAVRESFGANSCAQ